MNEELKLQLANEISSLIPDDIISVEENCGSIYVETASGKTYSISIIECEE